MNADFYIGLGDNAHWLGSIADQGGPSEIGVHYDLFNVSGDVEDYTEDDFRRAVAGILADAKADDAGFSAADGDDWPWDYPTSARTDYTYAWNNGCIHVFDEGYMVAQHYPNGARKPSVFPKQKIHAWQEGP